MADKKDKKDKKELVCCVCDTGGARLCTGCGIPAYAKAYCGVTCQKEHWPKHKLVCRLAPLSHSLVIRDSVMGIGLGVFSSSAHIKPCVIHWHRSCKVLQITQRGRGLARQQVLNVGSKTRLGSARLGMFVQAVLVCMVPVGWVYPI